MKKGKGYGIHNFHIPDDEMRKLALGPIAGSPYRIKNVLKVIPPFFHRIDPPEESDWLYNQEEQGQTYDTYLGQMHNNLDEKRSKIYIVPLQSNIPQDFLKRLQRYCQAFFYGVPIIIHKTINIKTLGVKQRENNGKLQFHAKQILKALENILPKDAFCLMGVCMTDLYHKEEWNFVFGLASLRERTGVFSFARYDEGFFEQQKKQPDYDVLYEQAVGVLVHEIGHMFGIRHCIYNKCVMNGSNHLAESKKKPLEPCPSCLRKLQSNAKFDMYERYKAIKEVLQKQCKGEKAERTWKIVDGILNQLRTVFEK